MGSQILARSDLNKLLQRCLGLCLSPSEIIYLLRDIFYSGADYGMTYKHLIKYFFVISSNQKNAATMPHRQIEVSSVDVKVIRDVEDLKLTKEHYQILSLVLGATMPKQPTTLQDCLRKAIDDNKVFFTYKTLGQMLRNIGVQLEYKQEKILKELLVERQIMRLSRIGDMTADVDFVH